MLTHCQKSSLVSWETLGTVIGPSRDIRLAFSSYLKDTFKYSNPNRTPAAADIVASLVIACTV